MRIPFAIAIALTGCPDRSISEVTPLQNGAVVKKIPVSADIDVLFVIDNSASTLDKQTVFSANFPKFVQALDAFPSGRPNLHIGVIDTTIDIGVQGWANGTAGCPSPDPLDNGLLQNVARVAGCVAPQGQFLADIKNDSGTRTTNYSGTLDQALSCIALVGANGCGLESPLEAMKRALDGSKPQNTGFVRTGAYLAVIFLTDEDDASVKDTSVFALADGAVGGHNDYRVQPLFAYGCDTAISSSDPGTYKNCKPRLDSYLQDPAFYSTFLDSVKDPAQIVVAVIAAPPPGLTTNDHPGMTGSSPDSVTVGPLTLNGNTQTLALQPSCMATINGNPAIGRPAVRLASFLSNFGSRGRFYSVCQTDYSAALTDIGATLFNAISPCLEGQVDTTDADPNNPGQQLDCVVSDVVNPGTATEMSTPMPACPMSDPTTPAPNGPRPCYWVDMNTTACPAPDTGYELKFERTSPPALGTDVDVECSVSGT
ncbi:MAG: hypothetical protein QM831_39095 [Kofleriaceae bacterium]